MSVIVIANIVCPHPPRDPILIASLHQEKRQPRSGPASVSIELRPNPELVLRGHVVSRGYAVFIGRGRWRLKCLECGPELRIGREQIERLGTGLLASLGAEPHVLDFHTLVRTLTSLHR